VSAFHDSKLVGYGKAIADGVHHAIIVDTIVHPNYQRKGIGVLEKCRAHRIRNVQLKNGSEHRFVPGMSFHVADDTINPHLAYTETGAKVFVVD
jgi:GNAT superfamily N-acetyltransferase